MRKLFFLILLLALAALAQNPSPIQSTGVAPSGACGSTNVRLLVPNGTIYTCQNNVWMPASGGGGGGGTVTNITTTAPISGGPITTTGAISCPTCVVGPSSVTNNHLAAFDGTTGKLIKDGGVAPSIPTIASTTSTLKGDGAGNAVPVAGTGTNCVLVNGSSATCTSTANYSQTFTTQTSVALTHNLNTTAVITQCYDNSSVNLEWNTLTLTDVNTITVTFTNAQTGKCVVTGNLATTTNFSLSTTCGVSGGPITGTGTLSGIETVNSQTGTSYAIQNGDCGKLVSLANGSAIAVSIAQAGGGGSFISGWYADVQNTGVGTVTITPTTSTINGASTLTLLTGQGVRVISDGSNYFIAGSISNGGTVQNITINNSTTNNIKMNHTSLNGTELTNLFPNAASTGTTLNKLVKLTGAGTGVIAATSDTGGIIGICTGNTSTGASACGTSGSSEIAIQGTYVCIFDNSTTANDYVVNGTNGACHDAGATFPTGTQALGRVLVTAAAGTRSMMLFGPEIQSNSGSTSLLDTYANIAATTCNSGNNGQIAFTSNSVYTGRCNGSAWAWFFRGVSVTPPPTTGWTLEAAMGATQTNNADGTVTFYFPARAGVSGGSGLGVAYRTGAATQTITALLCTVYADLFFGSTDHADNSLDNNVSDALGLRDTGGKYSAYFLGSAGVAAKYFSSLDYWDSATAFNQSFNYPNNPGAGVSATQLVKVVAQDCHWFQVVEDATLDTWNTNYIGNGNGWFQFIQKSRTDFLASGTHNPGVLMYNNNVGGRITLVSWLAQ